MDLELHCHEILYFPAIDEDRNDEHSVSMKPNSDCIDMSLQSLAK